MMNLCRLFKSGDGQAKDTSVETILNEAVRQHQGGDSVGAEAGYNLALSIDPENAAAIHFLGMLAHQAGRHEQGLELVGRSIELKPNVASFRANLGAMYGQLNRAEEAVCALRVAIRLKPDFAQAHFNLGLSLESLGLWDEAAEALRAAQRHGTAAGQYQADLARVLAKAGKFESAAAEQRIVADRHADFEPLQLLAAVYEKQGRLGQYIQTQRRAIAARPNSASAHSAYLHALLHDPAQSAEDLFKEHSNWATRHTAMECSLRHSNDRSPTRKLRVGYVSPAFLASPIPCFFEPILESHDRDFFAVVCYSDARKTDDITRRLKGRADSWRDTSQLSDDDFCKVIQADAIDILVDLTGHGADNRLCALSRRPAPVQGNYLYPHSTAVPGIDFRLSDIWLDPPGDSEQYSSERIERIAGSAWCYRALSQSPHISGLPSLAKGYITFGSVNRLLKITPTMIEVWAKLLQAVPKSRLLAIVEQEEGAREFRQRFSRLGVREDRIEAVARKSYAEYLSLAHRIDIALDPFPYNGQTTTYDMLWMGLPVVTLAGDKHISRVGLNLLTNLGMSQFVAWTPEEYVQIASELAMDLPRLRGLRATLRERLRNSVLMDGPGLTLKIERIYRQAWARWVAEQ